MLDIGEQIIVQQIFTVDAVILQRHSIVWALLKHMACSLHRAALTLTISGKAYICPNDLNK